METRTGTSFMDLVKAHAKTVIIVIALLFLFGFKFVTPFSGLNALSMEIIGIFIGAMLLWLFVSITWPSLLVMIALMLTRIYTFNQVLAGSMGAWVLSFVLFSTALCHVLREVGFFKRLAIWFLTRKIVSKNAWTFVGMLGLAAIIVGSFMAQLTIFIILVPIVVAIFEELDYEKGDRAPMLIMIGLLMFTTYANFTTPIGKVMPIMAMTLYTRFTGGLEISIFNYMLVGIPLTVVVFVVTMLFLKLTFKADFSKLENIDTEFLKKDIEPMSRKEKISALVFAVVIFLWLAPGVLEPITFLQPILQVIAKMGAPTPPMIGIIVLCIIKDEGEPIVDVEKLLREGVTWSVILIIAATAILGDALTNAEAGIPDWIGGHLSPILSQLPPIICVLLILTVAIVMTNFVSDMVTVMLLASISLPMIISGAVPGINAAALAYLIGQASTIGPATAVGGASSAIASGNGYLSPSKMFSWGMVLSLLCALLLTFIGYPLANALM